MSPIITLGPNRYQLNNNRTNELFLFIFLSMLLNMHLLCHTETKNKTKTHDSKLNLYEFFAYSYYTEQHKALRQNTINITI